MLATVLNFSYTFQAQSWSLYPPLRFGLVSHFRAGSIRRVRLRGGTAPHAGTLLIRYSCKQVDAKVSRLYDGTCYCIPYCV